MKRYLAAAALVLLIGCRGKHHRTSVENEEPPATAPRISTGLRMSDPNAQSQLVKGFYGVESGAWRWTAGKFSVLLRPPAGSGQKGATLSMAVTVPDVLIQKLGALTLTASVGATKLKSETYSAPGARTFAAEVPPEVLTGDTVTLDFSLDKSIPAGQIDRRELGVIVTSVNLAGK